MTTHPTNGVWRAGDLTGCHTLHMLAQTDPAEFRARLAALSDDDLKTQATLYSLYASTLCDRPISEAETLEHFRLSVDVHRAQQRSEDAVCHVLWELALTDAPALIEFLRGHTDQQREQLAWRFAAWLGRECEIVREPSHILRGWQQLIVGAAASGAERLQIELADCLGYVAGWDAVAAMWAEQLGDAHDTNEHLRARLPGVYEAADASCESYDGMKKAPA